MSNSAIDKFTKQLELIAADTGLDNNIGLFPANSEFRRLSIAPSTFFGAARALLLQIAYPVVAQGIYDHSDYDTNPTKRAIRTFLGVFAISLGSQNTAVKIAGHVFKAHIPIKGKIPGYQSGMADRNYSALEPEANLWVWATLVEGIMFGHKEVGFNVPRERLEEMYEEAKIFGLFFNVKPKIIPETLADFESYFSEALESKLEVTPAGIEVGNALLSGARFPYTLFSWLFRSLTVESLPDQVREDFGWQSTTMTKTVYGTLRTSGKVFNRLTPGVLKPTPVVWYPIIRRKLRGPGEALKMNKALSP